VLVNQGRQAGHVFREHWKAFGPELLKCRIDIKRVPENDDIDYQSEGSKLVFLSFPIALAQFAPLAMCRAALESRIFSRTVTLLQLNPGKRWPHCA
jgi:hypothetical protein